MKDIDRNEGTNEMEMEDGTIRRTAYKRPSLIEYGSMEVLTQGGLSGSNDSLAGTGYGSGRPARPPKG